MCGGIAFDPTTGRVYNKSIQQIKLTSGKMTSITQKFNHTYDPANRLTSVNGQAVQWDDNGNMLADGQAVYKYNTANKLVGVTKGTSSIVYAYSGLGDRLRQIADGVTTDYTLDINAGLTQVLQDNTNKYVYGNQRISQIAETQTGYFLPDALGSMRQMTDPSSDLTLARTYDPYGNVVSSSGAGETVYGYTGEIQSGGLVHLRARDYASQLGRFTSRDTWEGQNDQPISHNKWQYANINPANYGDPTGYFSQESSHFDCSHDSEFQFSDKCHCSTGPTYDIKKVFMDLYYVRSMVGRISNYLYIPRAIDSHEFRQLLGASMGYNKTDLVEGKFLGPINIQQLERGLLQYSTTTLSGQALLEISTDPMVEKINSEIISYTKRQQSYMFEDFDYEYYSNQDNYSTLKNNSIYFGGKSWFEAVQKPGTFEIRNATYSAYVHSEKDGQITINYHIEDVFDLVPSEDHELHYVIVGAIIAPIYHDFLGGSTEMITIADWTTIN